MLRFVVHDGHRATMFRYLEDWAGAFRSHVEILSYDELLRSTRLPVCVHVFTDLDRIDATVRESACSVWNALHSAVPGLELLNHPLRVMHRYELLRSLHEAGINDFDVYRLTEARRPSRYPVFLRVEDEHVGPETGLLHSYEELRAAVDALPLQRRCREGRMAVEYHAVVGSDGCYRKYAAFYVAGVVIPRHIFFATDWLVKGRTKIIDDNKLTEETEYMDANPHEQWIRSVFELARIDYGRIDYTVVAGRPQAYEVNTNPTIVPAETTVRTDKNERFTSALTEAFAALETRNQRNGSAAHVVPAPPLKSRTGRVVGRVLAKVLRRQLRPLV
jgi:hypothetical protein